MSIDKGKRVQTSKVQQLKPALEDILPAESAASSLKSALERLRDRSHRLEHEGLEPELQQFLDEIDRRIVEDDAPNSELHLLQGSAYRLLGELQLGEDAKASMQKAADLLGSDVARGLLENRVDQQGDYGVVLAMLGHDDEAVEILRQSTDRKSSDPGVYFCLGAIVEGNGEQPEAKRLYQKAVDLSPGNPLYLWALSELLVAEEDLEGASECLLEALTSPWNAGMLDWVLEIGKRLEEIDPRNALGLMLQGEALLQTGDFQSSGELLNRALDLDSENPWIFYSSSRAEQALGNLDDALALVDRGLALDRQHAQLWLQRANVLYERSSENDVERAETAIKRCLEIDPKNLIGRIAQANLYEQTARYEEALRSLDQALALAPGDSDLLLNEAHILSVVGRNDQALERVATVASALNASTYDLLNASDYFLTLGSLQDAMKAVDKALMKDAQLVDALVMKGSIHIASEQFSGALATFDQALCIEPENPDAVIGKASTLSSMERWDEALAFVGQALQRNPDDPEFLNAKAEVLLGQERYDEAADALQAAINRVPDPLYLNNLGLIKIQQELYEDALDCFKRAIDELPDDVSLTAEKASVLRGKASALRMLGRDADAVEAADHALRLMPKDPLTLIEKGLALAALQYEREAIASLQEAVALSPGDAETLYFQGLVFQILQRNDKALSSYEKALAIEPDYLAVLSGMSSLLRDKGDSTKALHYIDRALASDQHNLEFLSIKASILSDMGDYEAAVTTLDAVDSGVASDWWLLSNKGWALENLGVGRAADAKQAYDQALATAPEFPNDLWVRKGLANALRMLGDYDGAHEQYRKVLEELDRHSDMVDADTLAMRGWCHYQLSDFELAVDVYMEALSLKSDMPSTQLDLALAIMCMGRFKVGTREYQNALERLQRYEPARQRGLLSVALDDLAEAIEKDPKLSDISEVREVRSDLQMALSMAEMGA